MCVTLGWKRRAHNVLQVSRSDLQQPIYKQSDAVMALAAGQQRMFCTAEDSPKENFQLRLPSVHILDKIKGYTLIS